MIRVAVADDQQLVRSGFSVLLRSTPDIEVVGEAADGAEAVELALRTLPDVVLMDIRMPQVDGLEATRRLTADPRACSVRVLILTTFREVFQPRFANTLVNAVLCVLLVVFAIRLAKTKKFMPAGLMLVVTVAALALRNIFKG